MQEPSMQIWAHCPGCGVWFAIPSDTVEALVATRCAGCGEPPGRVEQRLGDLVIELDVRGGRSPDTPMQGVG